MSSIKLFDVIVVFSFLKTVPFHCNVSLSRSFLLISAELLRVSCLVLQAVVGTLPTSITSINYNDEIKNSKKLNYQSWNRTLALSLQYFYRYRLQTPVES